MSKANTKTKKNEKSSVRHTRAIQRERRIHQPACPPPEEFEKELTRLVYPAALAQQDTYRQLKLRARILTLPVMVALILSMIWRQVGGICELTRLVQSEALLWIPVLQVTQQAISERLATLPAVLLQGIFYDVLPQLEARWPARHRPRPPEIAWAQAHYTALWVADGSTLDALVRKMGLLRQAPTHPLAGRITALLNLTSRLPGHVWYQADAQAHDQGHWPEILKVLTAGALVIFDLGYTNFQRFRELTAAQVTFITRAKNNLAYKESQTLLRTPQVHDVLVWIGQGATRQQVRLVQVLYHGSWRRYLTNELDPQRLPPAYVVALYAQRWRVEDAFSLVKRLLGLAYFWSGSQNAIELQIWGTWLLYAVLIDLTDQTAEALHLPFADISIEMVYRSLYYYSQAHQRGEATDILSYYVAHARPLGLVKRKRKPDGSAILDAILALTSKPTLNL